MGEDIEFKLIMFYTHFSRQVIHMSQHRENYTEAQEKRPKDMHKQPILRTKLAFYHTSMPCITYVVEPLPFLSTRLFSIIIT